MHITNKKGEWLCQHCGVYQDPKEFVGQNGKETKLCETCRSASREAMRRHHDRKRMGISVGRNGRPSLAPGAHIKLEFNVPYPIHLEVEAMVVERILRYQRENPITPRQDKTTSEHAPPEQDQTPPPAPTK